MFMSLAAESREFCSCLVALRRLVSERSTFFHAVEIGTTAVLLAQLAKAHVAHTMLDCMNMEKFLDWNFCFMVGAPCG